MKRNTTKLLTAAILLASGQQAFAATTSAGTTVSNVATVSYTVSGTAQTAAFNDPAAEFKVDRKINVTVVASETTAAPNDVVPKETGPMLTFTVTNNTNDTMDFALGAVNASGDDFNVNGGITYFVDNQSSGTVGSYDAADTATYIDELPQDASIKVFVFAGAIPDVDVVSNGDQAGIVLTATARKGSTIDPDAATPGVEAEAIATDDALIANTTDVDNVFADVTPGDTDLAKKGDHSDTGFYEIATSTITVDKQSFVMWDPINYYTNPKAIPGAIVVYCIYVTNPSASVQATNISVSDPITTTPGQDYTGFLSGSIATSLTNSAPACDAATLIDASTDTGTGGDAGDAAYLAAATLASKTDVQDPGTDDGGYYVSGTETVHTNTATLDTTSGNNVATTVFRVTVK